MKLKEIFINEDEKRLKAGFRIFFFLVLFWSFSSLIFVLKPLLGDLSKREFLNDYSLLIISILTISATISTLIARKYFDKLSFSSLGLTNFKKGIKDILFGFGLSGLIAALFFIIALTAGLIEFNGFNFNQVNLNTSEISGFAEYMKVLSAGSLLLLLLETILVGYWEELFFRGYFLQNLAAGLNLKKAVIIPCLLYGLVHYTNPNAGILSSVIIIIFGFMRIYGYLVTKLLWLSIGMHIGWNFFQGPIFGFAASGHEKVSVFNIDIVGVDWLSGGAFGPEGSIIILPLLIFALFAMRWWSEKNYPLN